jgi:hypothetical protein
VAEWRSVPLYFPEAQTLADLGAIEFDLMTAERFCDLLIDAWQRIPQSAELLQPLSSAVLVRYARPFMSGKRLVKVREEVLHKLSEQQKQHHDEFIALRSKHIAHSVNVFEENTVMAILVPEERGPRGIASVNVQQHTWEALGIDEARRLKALCESVTNALAEIKEKEEKKFSPWRDLSPWTNFIGQRSGPGRGSRGATLARTGPAVDPLGRESG